MNNELIEQKSWWNQNWKWLIPVSGIILISFTIFFSSGMDRISTELVLAYTDNELYENALEKIKADKRVVELLGEIEPIDNLAILEGSVLIASGILIAICKRSILVPVASASSCFMYLLTTVGLTFAWVSSPVVSKNNEKSTLPLFNFEAISFRRPNSFALYMEGMRMLRSKDLLFRDLISIEIVLFGNCNTDLP